MFFLLIPLYQFPAPASTVRPPISSDFNSSYIFVTKTAQSNRIAPFHCCYYNFSTSAAMRSNAALSALLGQARLTRQKVSPPAPYSPPMDRRTPARLSSASCSSSERFSAETSTHAR